MRKRCIVESARADYQKEKRECGVANDSETTHQAATLPSSRAKRNGCDGTLRRCSEGAGVSASSER
jgi:hypothetical protein